MVLITNSGSLNKDTTFVKRLSLFVFLSSRFSPSISPSISPSVSPLHFLFHFPFYFPFHFPFHMRWTSLFTLLLRLFSFNFVLFPTFSLTSLLCLSPNSLCFLCPIHYFPCCNIPLLHHLFPLHTLWICRTAPPSPSNEFLPNYISFLDGLVQGSGTRARWEAKGRGGEILVQNYFFFVSLFLTKDKN